VTPGQRSLTMFAAVPVRRDHEVLGAVVASQSTFRILRALYDVRLRVFEIVLASLVAAAGLTALAATTIVRPLTRLRQQASTLAERRGPSPVSFPGAGRKDELGELARALEELTRRTNDHIALLHAFSADVSHELKNPIASIRTAAEMMAGAASETERHRFLRLMMRDVSRLERLVSSLRDIAIVERQIETDAIELVDVGVVLREVADAAQRHAGSRVSIDLHDAGTGRVRASRERLAQVFENLVANAVSFAPDGTAVEVRASSSAGPAIVTVEDRGPGIPESHLDRVFARFFTYRPAEGRGDHVGLGLAIARQIVESYGGSIVASNRDGGGAHFAVRLPSVPH
jgi:two-component system, OmpR family, sensor histidine kinase ChvG